MFPSGGTPDPCRRAMCKTRLESPLHFRPPAGGPSTPIVLKRRRPGVGRKSVPPAQTRSVLFCSRWLSKSEVEGGRWARMLCSTDHAAMQHHRDEANPRITLTLAMSIQCFVKPALGPESEPSGPENTLRLCTRAPKPPASDAIMAHIELRHAGHMAQQLPLLPCQLSLPLFPAWPCASRVVCLPSRLAGGLAASTMFTTFAATHSSIRGLGLLNRK